MKIILATQNPKKIEEIRSKLIQFKVQGLDADIFPNELLETGKMLEENALQKARQVYAKTRTTCFADDTGLEVEALNGEPGVYSARYAGEQKNSDDNMNLLLSKLAGKTNRNAQFRTVIALIVDDQEHLFEGVCRGEIIEERRGEKGFGYDPIFVPVGYETTFAEMDLEIKNEISHRGLAVGKLINFLKKKI